MISRLYVDRLEDTLLIPYQSVFAITDRTCSCKAACYSFQRRKRFGEWVYDFD